MRRSFALILSLFAVLPAGGAGRRLQRADIATPAPLPPDSLLIVGFLGGWEAWDHPNRSVRQLALRLRDTAPDSVFVETADNRSRGTVRKFIREALDRDGNGKLEPEEARAAQIICYGQSFGAAACVHLARELQRWNVPVRLTVQIDSVGRRDHTIPANVRRAVNLYQRDPGPIRGRARIRAADPSRTTILANLRHTYLFRDIDLSNYPPAARRFAISHWKMDNDPLVWAEVEGFIRAEIAFWLSEQLHFQP
ncbi:MAG: hypothetical protein KJZ84_12980 [Bryobacteraceae bacterium]|nr:hypothetical protein [Bryobacteraceae bacterium]